MQDNKEHYEIQLTPLFTKVVVMVLLFFFPVVFSFFAVMMKGSSFESIFQWFAVASPTLLLLYVWGFSDAKIKDGALIIRKMFFRAHRFSPSQIVEIVSSTSKKEKGKKVYVVVVTESITGLRKSHYLLMCSFFFNPSSSLVAILNDFKEGKDIINPTT